MRTAHRVAPRSARREHGTRQQRQRQEVCTSSDARVLDRRGRAWDVRPMAPPAFLPPFVAAPLVVLHADVHLAVVVKPRELLSCPGTSTPDFDSVTRRISHLFPLARGPLLAHRLDAPTSGLMVVALTPEIHRELSLQFATRSVSKAYQALLAGILDVTFGDAGLIDLPMRSEWRLRPRQVIDRERGKPAETRWRVMVRDATRDQTRIHFEPITGRTHQLRLHAAEGLGLPIVGDRIYGPAPAPDAPLPAMYLHATALAFTHPATGERLAFESAPDF